MKQIKIITIFSIALSFIACDLEPLPTAATSANGFYSDDSQIEAGIINIYDGIQGVNALEYTSATNFGVQIEYQLTEMLSDNTQTKSGEGVPFEFESFTVDKTNGSVLDYYRSYFNIIFRANTVLGNLDAATPANAASFEAEAKFLRAYAYFNLVRLFGDLPLVDRVIALSETDVQYTRVPQSQIYDLIISDFQFAMQHLDNSYRTRASLPAAQALLAKVYLTLGTNYGEATSLCEAVMNPSNGYSLESDFSDVFYTENNNEVIFAIGYQSDTTDDSQTYSAEWLNGVGRSSGLNYVTLDAKDALDLMGGDRTVVSYREDTAQPGNYQVTKYLPDSSDKTKAGNDWIVLRYADVLLMLVEANIGAGTETSDGNARDAFNLVRDRANMPLIASTDPVTKQELSDERRVELAFENHRFFDLKRFGYAESVLSAFSSANGFGYNSTDLLLPIPSGEIGISGGLLSQNPGY